MNRGMKKKIQNTNSSFRLQTSSLCIISAVIIVHALCIGTAIWTNESLLFKQPLDSQRLYVQTIALEPNPLPRNPIPKNPIQKQPIPPTPIMPTPLEHKTMAPPYEPPRRDQPAPVTAPTPAYQQEPLTPPEFIPPRPPPIPVQPIRTPPKPVVKPAVKEEPIPKAPPVPKEAPASKPAEQPKSPATPAAPPPAPKVPVKPPGKPDLRRASEKAEEEIKKYEEEQKKKEASQKLAETERQKKLFDEAQERIARISSSRDKISTEKTNSKVSSVPSVISRLEVDAMESLKEGVTLSTYEMSYRDELAARLKLLLRLPEHGDVKVSLTLDRAGKVYRVAIVSSQSNANRKYIEKTLPELSFPAFGSNFALASEYTFSITLSNEI